MKNFVVILALTALAAATVPNYFFDNLVEITPPEALPSLAQLMSSNLAIGDTCPSEQIILKANTDWLMYLGISTSYTWKNATSLWVIVRNMLKQADVSTFQNICRSRDLFYITLGQENYYHCINVFSLMHYTTDWSTAAYYVRMWQHLDFMCNVGFQQFLSVSDWNCLTLISGNQGCNDAYLKNVNYTNVCPAVQDYTQCVKKQTDIACNPPNGYFNCEDIRLGYGAECDIRCYV